MNHTQPHPQQNKEFIELLQQQNKNLAEENKSKTIIIQMLVENQNNLNKIDLESNSTQKFEIVTRESNPKLSFPKTDEIKCYNRYHEKLYTDDNDDESCNSYDCITSSDRSTTLSDKISDEISSGNIQKKKNWEYQVKGRKQKYCQRKKIANAKFKQLKKEKVFKISIKTGIIINLKQLSKECNQLSVMPLRENAKKWFFSAIAFLKT